MNSGAAAAEVLRINSSGQIVAGEWQATTISVSKGGTGATSASAARTSLGLAIGSDVQAYDSDLSAIASLSPTKGNLIVGDGSNWIAVAVGSNDDVLTADISQTAGVKWAPGGGSHNLLSATHADTLAASVARGDLVVGNSTPKWSRLALGTANKVLRSDGTDAAWAAVALASDVSGTLSIANGGTGQNSAGSAFDALSPLTTRGDLIVRNASANTRLALGSSGQFLGSDGTDACWRSISGTSNQITVSNSSGNLTIATPQDIASGSRPTFKGCTFTEGSITADAQGISDSVTWNNSSVAFKRWILNVTATAADVGSRVFVTQLAGTDKFAIDKDGNTFAPRYYLGTSGTTYLAPGGGMVDSVAVQTGSGTFVPFACNGLEIRVGALFFGNYSGNKIALSPDTPTASRLITVPDLSGTMFLANGGQTITSATWNGGTVAAAYGGTGQNSFTAGDLLYSTGTTTLSKLGIGAANRILTSSGSAPQWSTVASSLDSVSSTQGAVLYRDSSAWAALGPGTVGQVLQTGGASANPAWTTPAKHVEGLRLIYDSATQLRVKPGTCRDSTNATTITVTDDLTGDPSGSSFGSINNPDSLTNTGTVSCSGTNVTGSANASFMNPNCPQTTLTGSLVTGGGSSTTVTGSGTRFLDELNAGSLIGNSTDGWRYVTAVGSNTSCTVDGAISITSATAKRIDSVFVLVSDNSSNSVYTYVRQITSNTAMVIGQSVTFGTLNSGTGGNLYWGRPRYSGGSFPYHVFLCSGASGTGLVFSSFYSRPANLPTGYSSYYRRIGSYKGNTSGQAEAFVQTGEDRRRWLEHGVLAVLSGGSSTTATTVGNWNYAPPTARQMRVTVFNGAASPGGNSDNINLYDKRTGSQLYFLSCEALNVGTQFHVPVDQDAGTFKYSVADGSQSAYLYVSGWEDLL